MTTVKNPLWLCNCGTQFLSQHTFDSHKLKGKVSCSQSKDSDLLSLLDEVIVPTSSDKSLAAFDGDLLHKQHLRSYGLGPSDPAFLELIKNENQGAYLLKFRPDLYPKTPNPSPHLQGTFFEFAFETDLVFRSQYIVRLSLGLKW
jgi:hypothetical protein